MIKTDSYVCRLVALSLLLLTVHISVCRETRAARNVVLLISDNQNKDDCGCYGNNAIQTPNIDQLARDGIRFLDAFATTASCGPSRAVIYSGLQTHSNGQYGHGHGIHTYRLAPKIQTVFRLLKDNGYHTALLGKQHTVPESAYPFTYEHNVSGRDVMKLADHARKFILGAGNDPFFLTIGYSDPHPTSRDGAGWGLKRRESNVPKVAYDPAEVIVPRYLSDRPEVRNGLAGYYQQITRLDHGIGEVLKVLEETGKADETLVIFTSDHGSSEPGAMGNHYEPGIQVPFIVRHPTRMGAGQTNSALVTLADITPTILDWTQTKGPKYPLHGRSFLRILDSENPRGWDEVMISHVCHEVTMYYPMRTIRDRRYKLIWNVDWRSEYPLPIDTLQRATWTKAIQRGDPAMGKRSIKKFLFRDHVELYDLKEDPDEVINLADRAEYAETRTRLSKKLNAWLEETNDQWLVRHRLPMPGEDDSSSTRQANLDRETGYVSIFNGQNLDGWVLRRSDRGGYVVEDGLLICPEDGGGYLFTEKEYSDFKFEFDFRLSSAANSGVAIRCPLVDAKPAYEGMEIQILENATYSRQIKPNQYHGSLYGLVAAKRGALNPVGEWNKQEIHCEGDRVVVTVNDIVVLDTRLSKIKDKVVIQQHPGLNRKAGRIGLLGHDSHVEFKNLRVKEL